MQTATEFHHHLTAEVTKSSQKLRRHPKMAVTRKGHQGDVYVHRIDAIPAAWDVEVREHHQVALGATIGSRHVADGPALTVLWPKSLDAAVEECPVKGLVKKLGNGARFCLGPVVKADKPWRLTHPEHAHHEFPAGNYLVTYQLDYARQRQVQD
jgi:hypothetical protein